MIDVWSVFWGNKYHAAYVYALREGVERHLTKPHRFRCLTDHDLPGVDCVKPPHDWPGWWNKLNLFDVADGPSLYFDLDVVITGSLDYLAELTRYEFAAPANWAQSGYGGVQSSVMAWDGTWREPFERFERNPKEIMARLWGDQEFIWEIRGDEWVRIPGVYSFKYHCRGGLRGDESVVVFHGEPKQDVVNGWMLQYTITLRSIINDSMLNGYDEALAAAAAASSSRRTPGAPTPTSTSSAGPGSRKNTGSGIPASS